MSALNYEKIRYSDALLKIKIIYTELSKGLIPRRMYDLFKREFVEVKMLKVLLYNANC